MSDENEYDITDLDDMLEKMSIRKKTSRNGEHVKEYCDLCKRDTIICGYCGNNCCNGGTGTRDNGEKCGCEEAYLLQKLID